MDDASDTSPVKVALQGPFKAAQLRGLAKHGAIDTLSLTAHPLMSVKLVKELKAVQSVRDLHLWCETTRAAMRHVVSLPGLEVLSLFSLRKPGVLEGFSEATSLKTFRSSSLSSRDVREICRAPNLEVLGVQHTHLSLQAFEAIKSVKKLRDLDVEGSNFDDEMAAALASSRTIDELLLGATRVTAKGLRHICTMTQLRALDIWALNLQAADLEMLGALRNLEYISVGGYEGQTALTAENVLPILEGLPSLKRIWLDGIALTETQMSDLREKYESVQFS